MENISYKDNILHLENVSLKEIANYVGTPFYVYSSESIRENYLTFNKALEGTSGRVFYAVKANSNLAILKLLGDLGAGMDVVSIGEYFRARAAGVAGEKIVFSGVGKRRDEMKAALQGGIKQFNVESESELFALNSVSMEIGKIAPISVRVNPDVDAKTHKKISTGLSENKFGVPMTAIQGFCKKAADCSHIELMGLDVHIGSQLTELEPYGKAFKKIAELTKCLKADGYNIRSLDLGGGLGIPYNLHTPAIDIEKYVDLVKNHLLGLECELEFEPGRLIVGNAGLLVCSTIYFKETETRNFLILDGAMNDLIRPALYDAHHEIIPVKEPLPDSSSVMVDVVGPVCETGDTFARSRKLPLMGEDELVAILSAGAYGSVMSSEYNTRPLVPEVFVKANQFSVIRKRPSIQEILQKDIIPTWLN